MKPKFRAWLKKEQKMDNDVDHISWLEDELYCIGDGTASLFQQKI